MSTTNIPVRQAKHVVSDDVYQGNLTTIIQRDFFPDVPYLKHQLQAEQPVPPITEIITTNSPKYDLPLVIEVPRGVEEQSLRQKDSKNEESLNNFFTRTTNESNEKFINVQNKESKDRERKIIWLGNNTKLAKCSPSIGEYQLPIDNALFFIPKAVSNTQTCEKSDTEKFLQGTTLNEDIDLMPPPLPLIKVKNIQTSATRFPVQSQSKPNFYIIGNIRQTHLEGENSSVSGSDWESCTDASNASTNLDSVPLPLHIEREQGRERKMEERKIFKVKPRSGIGPDILCQPQQQSIWKTSESIPSNTLSYRIQDVSARDESARELAARKKHTNIMKKKSPPKVTVNTRSLSYIEKNALAKLNPSARALWMQTKKPPNRSKPIGTSFTSALRKSYNGSKSSGIRTTSRK